MSGETEKEILKILVEAMKREIAAQNLYKRGAELTDNLQLKTIFQKLYEEELQHEKLLNDMYHDYKKELGFKILH